MVCDNVPILCMNVNHGMSNNVAGGSFHFRRAKKAFSIFRAQKWRSFVKQPPNGKFNMLPPHFTKILDHLIWTISQQGDLKPFRLPLVKKTNSCRIDRKWVRYELQVHDLMLMIFLKSFLCWQYAISSDIQCKFSETRPRAKNLHACRFKRANEIMIRITA